MKTKPRISVVMTCYNQEKYIGESIESVLSQSYENFELIIINDGSQDNTQNIINNYSDSRIISKVQINSGPSSAINNGLKIARGDFIAFMSGDDVMFPERLTTQLNYTFSSELDIVFNLPKIINNKSRIIPNEFCPQFFGIDFFDTADLFKKLFMCGNFLCAPSCFAKRSAIDEIGMFNVGLIQLQDFDYWIRACKKGFSIKLFHHPLIMYRFLPGKNLSDEINIERMRLENSVIYESFLENVPNDLFFQSFQKEININSNDDLSIALEKTFLLYYSESILVKRIGYKKIIEHLRIPEQYNRIIENKYFTIEELFDSLKKFQFKNIQRDTRLIFIYDNLKIIIEKIGCLILKIVLGDKRIIKIINRKIDNNNTKNIFFFTEALNSSIRNILVWIKNRIIYLSFVFRYLHYFKNISNKYFLHKIRERRYGKSLHLFTYSSIYDYCKKNGEIIFHDKKEKIKLSIPNNYGLNNRNRLQTGYGYCPSPYISIIKDVVITGNSNYIISKEGVLLNDELVNYKDEGYGFKNEDLKFVHNNKAIIEIKQNDNQIVLDDGILITCDHYKNYFHWIVESLPKLAMINEIIGLDDIPLLVPNNLHQNLINALIKQNVHKNPIVFLDEDCDYLVKKLIYPSPLSIIMDRYHGNVKYNQDIILSKKWISKVAMTISRDCNVENDKSSRIYIHRNGSVRKVENQEEIEQILKKYNFLIIEPEKESLDEQIRLFANASLVIAPTGAALTNILFCKPGTEILIFMSNHESNNYYFWNNLGSISGLNIKIITGRRSYKNTNFNSVHDDYSIDTKIIIEEINKLLDREI